MGERTRNALNMPLDIDELFFEDVLLLAPSGFRGGFAILDKVLQIGFQYISVLFCFFQHKNGKEYLNSGCHWVATLIGGLRSTPFFRNKTQEEDIPARYKLVVFVFSYNVTERGRGGG